MRRVPYPFVLARCTPGQGPPAGTPQELGAGRGAERVHGRHVAEDVVLGKVGHLRRVYVALNLQPTPRPNVLPGLCKKKKNRCQRSSAELCQLNSHWTLVALVQIQRALNDSIWKRQLSVHNLWMLFIQKIQRAFKWFYMKTTIVSPQFMDAFYSENVIFCNLIILILPLSKSISFTASSWILHICRTELFNFIDFQEGISFWLLWLKSLLLSGD